MLGIYVAGMSEILLPRSEIDLSFDAYRRLMDSLKQGIVVDF